MSKGLFKFRWDCGRMGDLSGLFIADQADVNDLIGKEINFGEVLGKHSEIYGVIEEGEIKRLDVSDQTVNELEKAIGYKTISGYNPLDYYEEFDEEDEEEED